MIANLKVILLAIGAAALLASPAVAKSKQHDAAPSTAYIPVYVQGSAASYGAAEGGPYTPSSPTPSHGFSRDFQTGPRN